jgi:phosphoserine phosphatase
VNTPESRIRTPTTPTVAVAVAVAVATRLAVFDLDRTPYPGSSLKPLAKALCDRGLVAPVAVAPSRGLRRLARARGWAIIETGDR